MSQLTAHFRRVKFSMIPPWLILLVILTVLAAIIWATLGLKTTALFEHWGAYSVFSQGVSPFDTSVVGEPTRFFLDFFTWIGYRITPDSFAGLNLFNCGVFVVQGIVTFALIRRLHSGSFIFAFAVTILFLIYPADSGLANNRYLGYHVCIVFFLLSVYCLIDYWQYRRSISLVGMIVASLLNLSIVEISYPFVILMPLLLVWLEPAHRITRRAVRVAIIWYIMPAIMIAETIAVTIEGHTAYQTSLVQTGTQLSFMAHTINFIEAMFHAYIRILADGWAIALQQIDLQSNRFYIAILIAVLFIVGGLIIRKPEAVDVVSQKAAIPNVPSGRLAPRRTKIISIESDITWSMLGLLIIGLGFVIYGFLPTHQVFTERVYLLSSLGGAIIFTVIASRIGRFLGRERLFVLLSTALLAGIALQAGLVDALRTHTASEQEQTLLSQIAVQAPNLDKAQLVLLLDPTHQLATSLIINISVPPNILIKTALHYIYHSFQFDLRVCDPNTPSDTDPDFSCVLGTQDIRFKNGSGTPDTTYPLNSVVAFEYEGEGKLSLLTTWPTAHASGYNPTALVDSGMAPSVHVTTLFNQWPFQMHTAFNEHPKQSVSFDQNSLIMFLDVPTLPYISYGWIGNWTASTRSTLDVWLDANHDYQLKTVITHSTLPETLKHITLTVNDQPIALTAQTNADQSLTLTGTIPRDVVARDLTRTRITFLSDPVTSPLVAGTGTDPHFLGFQVDQFSVVPLIAN